MEKTVENLKDDRKAVFWHDGRFELHHDYRYKFGSFVAVNLRSEQITRLLIRIGKVAKANEHNNRSIFTLGFHWHQPYKPVCGSAYWLHSKYNSLYLEYCQNKKHVAHRPQIYENHDIKTFLIGKEKQCSILGAIKTWGISHQGSLKLCKCYRWKGWRIIVKTILQFLALKELTLKKKNTAERRWNG